MDLENQFELEHLFLTERTCRTCKITKNLIDGFYRTRKSFTHFHLHIHMSVKSVL